ncbi:MAG TPA: response regulator [Caproiciproducens sp.]|nr:response regulator [Caproiciproducens sp.]
MLKVIIVEDEDIIRKGLMFTMDWTKYGCVVAAEAVNGKDGLDKIREIHPDIVITDVKMPFMDGIQLLEESINVFHYEAVIISGYSEFEYAKKAIRLGVSDYLLKPIDMDSLGETLQKISVKIKEKEKFEKYIVEEKSEQTEPLVDPAVLNGHKTRYVQKMLDYIENHYKEKISISDLSAEMNLSSTYLNMKFKEETNYTFNDFLNRYRILRSVELLKQGNMKVYEVADSVGFQDYKYFISVFKKYIGRAPIKFINSY